MRIVITGGGGFLGSHLAEEASKKNIQVVVIDNLIKYRIKKKNILYFKFNLFNSNLLRKIIKKDDIVYHFAAISDIDDANLDPEKTFNLNVLCTIKLLKICKEKKIRKFIYASSLYVHTSIGGFYRVSKKSTELFIEEFAKVNNLNFVILRFGSVYGPRQDKNNNITNIVYNTIKYKKVSYSGHKQSQRKFIYVKDVAKALLTISSKKYVNKVYVISGKRNIKLRIVLNIIKKLMKISSLPHFKNIKKNHYIKNPYSYKEMKENSFVINKYTNIKLGIKNVINYEKKN